MINFFKKYKFLLISLLIIIIVLTIAFVSGGSLSETKDKVPSIVKETALESVSVKEVVTNNRSTDPTKQSESTNQESTQTSKAAVDKQTTTQSIKNKPSETASQTKTKPVEPSEREASEDNNLYCTFSISCKTVFNNLNELDTDIADLLPKDGWILAPVKIKFNDGESVYDVLERVSKANNIHLEANWTPGYNTVYIEGINNLYEFDCGEGSGWEYKVNNTIANFGSSKYQIKDGDTVEWLYTCDFGNDI